MSEREPPTDAAGRWDPRTDWPNRRQFLAAVGGTTTSALLAGCSEQIPTSFEATPVGFSETGMGLAGYESATQREWATTRSQSVAGLSADVSVTSYLTTYGVEASKSVVAGVLATPEIAVQGERFNPFATDPLSSVVASERARQLLTELGVVGADARWDEPPTAVDAAGTTEMFDTAVEVKRFNGRASGTGDEEPTDIVFTAARTSRDGDAVIALLVQHAPVSDLETDPARLRLPRQRVDAPEDDDGELPAAPSPNPSSEASAAADAASTAFDPAFMDLVGRLSLDLFPTVTPNPPGSGGGAAGISVEDVRLVQVVDETLVRNLPNSRTFSPARPDLVEEMPTTVLFDIDVQNPGVLPKEVSFEIRFEHRWGAHIDHVTFERGEIKDILAGSDIRGYLDEGARNDDHSKILSVVPLKDRLERVKVIAEAAGGPVYDTATIEAGTDWETTQKRVLNIGVWTVQDPGEGDNYGSKQGLATEANRAAWATFEYFKRTYPGGIRLFQLQAPALDGRTAFPPWRERQDFRRCRRALDRVASGKSSYAISGGGRFFRYATGNANNTSQLPPKQAKQRDIDAVERQGFDVTLLVTPGNDSSNSGGTDYYTYHGLSASGLYPGGGGMAVSTLDSTRRAPNDVVGTAGQEVGHYFTDMPYAQHTDMAQRHTRGSDDKLNGTQVDYDHARHEGSDLDGDGVHDVPGVTAVGYDLTDSRGRFRVADGFSIGQFGRFTSNPVQRSSGAFELQRMSSFMSYDNGDMWTDGLIRQKLIDSGYTHQGSTTSKPAQAADAESKRTPVLDVAGVPADDGSVTFFDVAAYEGYPQAETETGSDVDLELVTPGDEAAVTARLPRAHVAPHTGTEYPGFVATLPFPDDVVAVRARLDGAETRLNPITRSILDSLKRVPSRGLRTSPEAAVDAFETALEDVDASMQRGEYGAAAEGLAAVQPLVATHVRAAYESNPETPTRSELTALIERMRARLDGLI